MADSTLHPSTLAKSDQFSYGVYAIDPTATDANLIDHLNARLIQLDVMLSLSYGEGMNLNDAARENFMWACSDMATECKELFEQLVLRRTV